MESKVARRNHVRTMPILLLLAGVVAIWTVYGMAVVIFPFRGEFWDVRGKFGDMFGAFNALFTAGAFAAIIYEIRLEYKAGRREQLHTVLSAQLDTLVQLYALPESQRSPVWEAIVSASGGSAEGNTLSEAIVNQIRYIDRLVAGEELDFVPTYGRKQI